MNFKEWLMSEIQHIELPSDVRIDGKIVSHIDMKFEYYPGNLRRQFSFAQEWAARLPNSEQYIVFNRRRISVGKKPPSFMELPANWWQYALVEFRDGTMKQPSQGPTKFAA